jgi:hypothetical protein
MEKSLISLTGFSTEELNLMCIFDTASREALRNDLIAALHDVYEPDMIEVFGSTLEKLDAITDEDFTAIGFYIADDDDNVFTDGSYSDVISSVDGDAFGE